MAKRMSALVEEKSSTLVAPKVGCGFLILAADVFVFAGFCARSNPLRNQFRAPRTVYPAHSPHSTVLKEECPASLKPF